MLSNRLTRGALERIFCNMRYFSRTPSIKFTHATSQPEATLKHPSDTSTKSTTLKKLTNREALNSALDEELRRD